MCFVPKLRIRNPHFEHGLKKFHGHSVGDQSVVWKK
jgi:hypothetical protein